MRTLLAVTTLLIMLVSCRTQQVTEARRSPPPPETPEARADAGLAPAEPATQEGSAPLAVPSPPAAVSEMQPAERVEGLLRQMSLRQKIGQRFMFGFAGRKPGERLLRIIGEESVGGVVLTRGNIVNRAQVTELTALLQEAAAQTRPAIELLVGVDQEGGRVNRLDLEQLSRFPAPFYWTQYRDPAYVEAIAYVTAREALALGCNMNFAPVLDLYDVADGSVIGDRSMGPNPFLVAEQGVFYLAGARRAGITAVVKHFPGHGRTIVDSHRQLPVVQATEEDLWKRDLIPFQVAIDHGVDAVMTAHLLMPQLDPELPATMSAPIIRGLLRQRLHFDGVVVSDDIDMGALRNNFAPRQIVEGCIRAGVDLMLSTGGQDALALIDEVESLVEEGVLSEETIDEGVRRILRLKLEHGLLPAPGWESPQ
jgi:beta-N-acetylhexosaminidase